MTALERAEKAFRHLQYLAMQANRINAEAAIARAEVYAALCEARAAEASAGPAPGNESTTEKVDP